MPFFITFLILLVSAFVISVENTVQPDKFTDVFASLWRAVATLTTVGSEAVVNIVRVTRRNGSEEKFNS